MFKYYGMVFGRALADSFSFMGWQRDWQIVLRSIVIWLATSVLLIHFRPDLFADNFSLFLAVAAAAGIVLFIALLINLVRAPFLIDQEKTLKIDNVETVLEKRLSAEVVYKALEASKAEALDMARGSLGLNPHTEMREWIEKTAGTMRLLNVPLDEIHMFETPDLHGLDALKGRFNILDLLIRKYMKKSES